MPKVVYGHSTIEYSFLEKNNLKSHYITVQRDTGVILKGKAVSEHDAQQLILKKASWILEKQALVASVEENAIVTGARIPYLGRKYYVQIILDESLSKIKVDFTASKFKIYLSTVLNKQELIKEALQLFYKQKAAEKITPRIKKWAASTGLHYNVVKYRFLEKRWGSCTPSNTIIINIEAIKLSFTLIDYLIVHELVHTKIKSHSKEFWAELSKHIPNWKKLDAKMYGMKL
ncbi:M48 family metallopeptidase [Tenacibaculum amylolyticum]|uniref:M48 family metallopeptidase n=1 Tax=Tenacibaculum amylolyticum TaxID=104269 RepID=UPI0038951C12